METTAVNNTWQHRVKLIYHITTKPVMCCPY